MIDRSRAPLAAMLLGLAVLGCGQATPTSAPSGPSATGSPSLASPAATEPALSVAPTGTAAASAAATASPGAPPCAVADLKASHGLVEVSGDSRTTEVVLGAAVPCSVDSYPAIRLRDATGAVLVDAPSLGLGTVALVPGVAYSSEVRLANWCAQEPAFPLRLAIVIDGSNLTVTGASFPDDGDLPTCTAHGPTILEATAWNATP